MAELKVRGTVCSPSPTGDELQAISEAVLGCRLNLDEPRNTGVTLETHREVVVRAAHDKESIKDLIPVE